MNDLTNEQKEAVSHSKAAACVIAGAGTGKTTALAERIVFLVETQRIDPKRIIVTTFTRKATAELYDRTHKRLGEKAQQLRISTIDALIWDLAREAMNQGLMQSRQLIGEANQRVLLLDCAWEVFGNKQSTSRSSWTGSADKAGLVGLLEKGTRAAIADKQERAPIHKLIKERLNELESRFYLGFDFQIPTLQDLKRTANRYFERLNELSATDYDLLTKDFLQCLKRNKNLLKDFVSQADAIVVDEFQDTSRLQVEILLFLSGKGRKIWAVGDPCQQIYEWRGAGPDNMIRFIKAAKAKKYYLTDNWRSTQPILNSAYSFLCKRVPSLKANGMLKPLNSRQDLISTSSNKHPVYTSSLERALFFIAGFLQSNPNVKPSDIAILSRKMTKQTVEEIERRANTSGLKVQFHSTRADRAMERTVGTPPFWKPGSVLNNLYKHPSIQKVVAHSLRTNEFGELRTIRPLATAAEALDSTLPPDALSFREAWPALKITQDREVSLSSAVVNRPDALQVMTIHAAKGLEFPIVLLMKLGKGSPRSFPNPKDSEECRLAYVGATRARDLLILVHTVEKPHETLSAFGNDIEPIRRNKQLSVERQIKAPTILPTPPIIAATHLDLYEQCPLKFAAYHEGRLLPKWSIPQSVGSRVHKGLEYYLRSDLPANKAEVSDCFDRGFRDGDSPMRKLPRDTIKKMRGTFKQITERLAKTSKNVIAIEQRYRYLHERSGQIDGIIDAVIEQRDGRIALKEWKTSSEIAADKKQSYTLQASAGALGIVAMNSHPVQLIEVVPVFAPSKRIELNYDSKFVEQTSQKLDGVFRDLRDRKYQHRKGSHCKSCQLKKQCPAWHKS
jgi:superfamily I DNA/RNA helicase/CRISPR/Cas system-associated exonuclease Cas4 (RecB family)